MKRSFLRRWLGACVFGAVLGVMPLLGGGIATRAAHAQGFSWFGGILGGGTPERSPRAPAYPGAGGGYSWGGGGSDDASGRSYRRDYGDSDERAARRRAQRRKRAVEPPAQDVAKKAPSKADATVFVDVFGDGFGLMLANGLDDALADRPEVGIVRKARGSTGLVNTAFYDWPKAIDDLLKSETEKGKSDKKASDKSTAGSERSGSEKSDEDKLKRLIDKTEATTKQSGSKAKDGNAKNAKAKDAKHQKIDVAVMMIGSNDRQPITQDGKTYQRGSDDWNTIYRKRVLAIAEAFQKHKIPLIWVGLPIMKDDEFADDMAALNEIYKDAAAKTGATYVDSWEVFSDDRGDFAAFGPDVNGQTVRLRTPDGIFFTHAGARKLAHFVETHLRRDIDGKIPPPQLPTAEVPTETGKPGDKGGDAKTAAEKTKSGRAPSVAMVKPEAGPIKNLGEPPSAKDGALMPLPASSPDTSIVTAAGRAEPVPANRVDNFRWPESPKATPSAKPQTQAAPATK